MTDGYPVGLWHIHTQLPHDSFSHGDTTGTQKEWTWSQLESPTLVSGAHSQIPPYSRSKTGAYAPHASKVPGQVQHCAFMLLFSTILTFKYATCINENQSYGSLNIQLELKTLESTSTSPLCTHPHHLPVMRVLFTEECFIHLNTVHVDFSLSLLWMALVSFNPSILWFTEFSKAILTVWDFCLQCWPWNLIAV